MGQTLTHGVYLPDEGERNCYSGLAANWTILDGAVGTVAEHSTQISGKAPLVHTHVKADITDFPALANVATSGSYTDLSNIPASFTPASHSHGNITNDGKVGTTANKPLITGTGGVVQAGSFGNAANTFCEGNDSRLSDARTPVAHTHTKSDVTDLLNSNFIPSANDAYDLGSASKQWLNTYSKGYYYNGVAWGLDKENTWTSANTFQGNLYHKSSSSTLVKGTNPSSTTYYGSFRHQTYAGEEINLFRGYIGTTGDNCYRWAVEPWVSGSNGRFQMRVSSDGSVRAFEVDGTEVSPYTNNATNLGTSSKKWKTFNGINPGALSLPGTSYDPIDTQNWDFSAGTNEYFYTPLIDGWLTICLSSSATYLNLYCDKTEPKIGGNFLATPNGVVFGFLPIKANQRCRIRGKGDDINFARFYPCQGNV